jgi:excisionase family DNA binding protein
MLQAGYRLCVYRLKELRMTIRNLSTHSTHYVTIGELSDYWAVSRHRIYTWIESGVLGAIRLGSRLYRIPTQAALDFERRASVSAVAAPSGTQSLASPAKSQPAVTDKLPSKIGLKRVPKAVG